MWIEWAGGGIGDFGVVSGNPSLRPSYSYRTSYVLFLEIL